MEYRKIDLSTNAFSLGSILGTASSSDFIKQINASTGGSTYYGDMSDPYRNSYIHFMQNIVQPIRDTQVKLQAAKMTVEQPDVYRCIDSIEELERGVPPCMWPGILTYEPIRKLAVNNKIEAFGVDVSNYPTDDMYGRVLNSGMVEITPSTLVSGGVEIIWEERTTDPVLSIDEIEYLVDTRAFLHQFLMSEATEHIDPTSIPYGELRG